MFIKNLAFLSLEDSRCDLRGTLYGKDLGKFTLKLWPNTFMSNHITLEKVISTYFTVDAKNQQIKRTVRYENESSKL